MQADNTAPHPSVTADTHVPKTNFAVNLAPGDETHISLEMNSTTENSDVQLSNGDENSDVDTTQQPKAVPVIEDDFNAFYNGFMGMPLSLKVHLIVVSLVCLIVFFVWRYTTRGYWWWIYPLFFAILTFTTHYFIRVKRYVACAITALCIINIACVITWGITQPGTTGLAGYLYL